jgi:hypothetical protein
VSLLPRLPFIAIALTALALIPSAQALYNKADRTVEADNGAVYEILYITRNATQANAHILTPDNEELHFQFDCHGHMMVSHGFDSSSIRTVPPRSVAGRIAEIACAGPKTY